MEQAGLRLDLAKTRIVYRKDGDRRGSHGPRQERGEVHLVPKLAVDTFAEL
jgi:hypothetical protein